ncbi:MAG: spore coat protein CotJB [Bacilli bacterium]
MNNYELYLMENGYVNNYMKPAIMPDLETREIQNNDVFVDPYEGFMRGNMQKTLYNPYKSGKIIKPVSNTEKEKLMEDIQQYAFAAHDLNLYLDTHLEDEAAIKLYIQYNQQAEKLTDTYEAKYGPLTLSNGLGLEQQPWAWVKGTWPWEK